MEKVIYYHDELNDEFSGIKRNKAILKENFKYIHDGIFYKIGEFFVYWIVMKPIAFIYMKLKYHLKIENKKILKSYKKKGYFMFGNHTNIPGDAYIPNLLNYKKKVSVIVNSENLAVKGTKTFMKMVGALPIPDDFKLMRKFIDAVEKKSVNGNCIVIYPEAHVWPFYTKIRPFKSTSFRYPVQFDDPVFCFTTTYQKRKRGNKPNITVFIDGPFFTNNQLDIAKRKDDLRNKVYDSMVSRSKENTIEIIKYVKKEDNL